MAIGYNEFKKNDPRYFMNLKHAYEETLEFVDKLKRVIANTKRYPGQYTKKDLVYLENELKIQTAKAEKLKKDIGRSNRERIV